MDGVDVVVVRLEDESISTIGSVTKPYASSLHSRLAALIKPDAKSTVHDIATLNIEIAQHFARSAMALLAEHQIPATEVVALGSHGQTVRHHPLPPAPYSWQLGDGATIAATTGITTVADFRSLDVAYGGEGAPLVPPFHRWCFEATGSSKLVVNIGGISNITVVDQQTSQLASGYDIGPGNCLMDEWTERHLNQAYDGDGAWAMTGSPDEVLLASLLRDDYLSLEPPKSTGREHYNLAYLEQHLDACGLRNAAPENIQATLLHFTAKSIIDAADRSSCGTSTPLYVCGGGASNSALMNLLQRLSPQRIVATTESLGVDPNYVEAAAFAWLAQQRVSNLPVVLTTRTPPSPLYLGVIHSPQFI